jgi:hypothetical protein
MPKPSPKLDPVFEKTVARMLATPPQPERATAKKRVSKKKRR